jgi:hypothetical protein
MLKWAPNGEFNIVQREEFAHFWGVLNFYQFILSQSFQLKQTVDRVKKAKMMSAENTERSVNHHTKGCTIGTLGTRRYAFKANFLNELGYTQGKDRLGDLVIDKCATNGIIFPNPDKMIAKGEARFEDIFGADLLSEMKNIRVGKAECKIISDRDKLKKKQMLPNFQIAEANKTQLDKFLDRLDQVKDKHGIMTTKKVKTGQKYIVPAPCIFQQEEPYIEMYDENVIQTYQEQDITYSMIPVQHTQAHLAEKMEIYTAFPREHHFQEDTYWEYVPNSDDNAVQLDDNVLDFNQATNLVFGFLDAYPHYKADPVILDAGDGLF